MNNLAHIDAENSDVSENVNRLLHEASSKDASILFQ